MTELAQYLADTYGTCKLGSSCTCLRIGWPKPCPYWEPTSATTWEELKEAQKALHSSA